MKPRLFNIDGRVPVLRVTAMALTTGNKRQVLTAIDRTRELAVWCRDQGFVARWDQCCSDLRALAAEYRTGQFSKAVLL